MAEVPDEMLGKTEAVASPITMKVIQEVSKEGDMRADERAERGNNPASYWGSGSLPNVSPMFNITLYSLLFGVPRGYVAPTEPGGGYAPHAVAGFAGLVKPLGARTNTDVARAMPFLGVAFFQAYASNPSNYEVNMTSLTWGGFGTLPVLSEPIAPGSYVKVVRPDIDPAKAEAFEKNRFHTPIDPAGKYPATLAPVGPFDAAHVLRDSMSKYLTSGAFANTPVTALFSNSNPGAGTWSSVLDEDTDIALLQQSFALAAVAVGVRALADSGVITINKITDKAAWQRALGEASWSNYGAMKWDDANGKFVPEASPAAMQTAKNTSNDLFADVLQMLGLVSSNASILGSSAGFNVMPIVGRIMSTLYNSTLDGPTQQATRPEEMMPGASSAAARATQAALAQNLRAAFGNMATAVLQADSAVKADVAFFSHTGANKGGSIEAQLCI